MERGNKQYAETVYGISDAKAMRIKALVVLNILSSGTLTDEVDKIFPKCSRELRYKILVYGFLKKGMDKLLNQGD